MATMQCGRGLHPFPTRCVLVEHLLSKALNNIANYVQQTLHRKLSTTGGKKQWHGTLLEHIHLAIDIHISTKVVRSLQLTL